jgi:hypothetical protein
MTVGAIRRGMSYAELLGWMAFFSEVEVMPDSTREAAQICAVIANANRVKGSKAFRVKNFVPRVGRHAQSTEQMQMVFDRVAGGQ